jgi:hypothetical protein
VKGDKVDEVERRPPHGGIKIPNEITPITERKEQQGRRGKEKAKGFMRGKSGGEEK